MHSFCDEEKAELLPKNITRTAKMQLENYEHTSARVNILTLYPDLPRNRPKIWARFCEIWLSLTQD